MMEPMQQPTAWKPHALNNGRKVESLMGTRPDLHARPMGEYPTKCASRRRGTTASRAWIRSARACATSPRDAAMHTQHDVALNAFGDTPNDDLSHGEIWATGTLARRTGAATTAPPLPPERRRGRRPIAMDASRHQRRLAGRAGLSGGGGIPGAPIVPLRKDAPQSNRAVAQNTQTQASRRANTTSPQDSAKGAKDAQRHRDGGGVDGSEPEGPLRAVKLKANPLTRPLPAPACPTPRAPPPTRSTRRRGAATRSRARARTPRTTTAPTHRARQPPRFRRAPQPGRAPGGLREPAQGFREPRDRHLRTRPRPAPAAPLRHGRRAARRAAAATAAAPTSPPSTR